MKPGVIKVGTVPKNCQGCRSCEAVCSMFHRGFVSPHHRGIQIKEKEALGTWNITVCQQCFDMQCATSCPVGCITRNEYSGAVEIGADCTGCGACAPACPIGAIIMAPEESGEKKPYKCDLCGGLPECVSACPRNALSW